MGRHPPYMRRSIAVMTVLVVALAVTLVVGGDSYSARVFDDVVNTGLSTFAALCAVGAARAASGKMRRAWATMAAALAAWAVGDAIWLIYDLFAQQAPTPSPADLFYFGFAVLTAVAIAQFPTVSTGQSRLRIVLDAVTVALCLFLLSWIFILNSVFDTYRDDRVALSVALIYPVFDLVVLTIAVVVLARAEPRQRAVLGVLTLAIGLATIADSAFAYLLAGDHYATGNLIDIVWAASLAAFATAGLLGSRTPAPVTAAASVPSNSALWLPYTPLLVAGTVGPPMVMSGFESVIVPLIVAAVCVRQVVSAWENRRLLSAAADQALRDPLTGLANRTLFHDRLAHAMMLRSRDDRSVAVVSLDLDDFKLVNDSLGHPTADSVLVQVGQRITHCVRPGDTVARVGGDEFALLLEARVDESHLVAQRVFEAFNTPFLVDGQEMLMRPSIGVAVAGPADSDMSPETLIKQADIAMYAAKRSRSAEIHTFNADMMLLDPDVVDLAGSSNGRTGSEGAAQVRLLGELRHAIDRGDLDVVYQPKFALDTGLIVGVEALLRWPHPQLGTLRPDAFMSLVCQHGLMGPVTDLVVDRVLDDTGRWLALGVRVPVAVNLFAPSLRDCRLPDRLCQALANRGLPTSVLTVEITEDLVLSEVALVTAVLRRLRALGIRVAIDDFGSGYSALSYLRDLPIDEIKLDRHFIASVTADARAAAVVRAVIDLTHDLGITVVAEGVEDAETASWLWEHGCDIGQGYHFCKPVDADQIPGLVATGAQLG